MEETAPLRAHPTLLLAALIGAAALASGAALGATGTPLGKAATGEECRASPRGGLPPLPDAPPPLDVYCGDVTEPAGAVWIDTLPAGTQRDKAGIESTAKRTIEGQSIERRMSCAAGEPLGGDGGALVYSCTLKAGNWPQVVLRVAVGGRLYQAEGLPSMLGVLAKAIDTAAGRSAFPEAAAADLQRRQAALGSSAIGSGELLRFNEYMRLGRLYNSTRNYPASEDAFRKALEVQNRVFGPASPGAGEVLMELALAVSHQGRFDEAGALFRRAEPIVQKRDEAVQGRFFAYLAIDAELQGKYQEALGYARQSTALRRKQIDSAADTISDISAGDPHVAAKGELVHSLLIEGDLSLKLGDIAGAEAAVTEALEFLAQVHGLPIWWQPQALILLGQIEAAQNRLTFAERNLKRGVALEEKVFGKTAPTAQAYMTLARFYTGIQDYPAAIAAFRTGMEILGTDDTARSLVSADDVGAFLVAAAAVAAKDPSQRPKLEAEMFRASQLMSAGVADQAIENAAARIAAGDPAIAALVREEQEAERARDAARLRLAAEEAKPVEERGRLIEEQIKKDIDAANAKVAALQQKLQQSYPAYASFASPQPTDLATLQKSLAPDEAFVGFLVGREGAYLLLARADRLKAFKLDTTDAKLTQTVTDLRKAFIPRLGTVGPFDLRLANDLYRRLLGPAEADLAGVKHLVAAPAGALASLPLGLLVATPTAQGNYSGAEWLLRRMAISEVPSARAFVTLRAERAVAKPAPRPFLGLGNPSFTGANAPGQASALDRLAQSCREGGAISPTLIRALAPLPETAEEVRRVGQRLNADPNSILLGAAASEANLRRQALGDYNVIYFATHGLLPGELRCQSEPGLALSPPSGAASSPNDDGLLEASEIAGLKLNAELVVLSACNTGAGGGRLGGESLSGLADAFFHAGARTLVVSHWQVPSNATAALMTGFFDRLGPRLENGIAESLRGSQLALAGQAATAHPFYWAAFTVLGDGGARLSGRQSATGTLE